MNVKQCLALAILAATSSVAMADEPIVGLITKTDTNPFFVKMKEGAEAKAKELGLEFQAFAGKVDGDAGPQIEAIEVEPLEAMISETTRME